METNLNTSHTKAKAALIFTGLVAAIIFFSTIALHLNPLKLLRELMDFGHHHYFITGFISLAIASICYRIYHGLDHKADRTYRKTIGGRIMRTLRKYKNMRQLKEKLDQKKQAITSRYIDKNQVGQLKFPKTDVLSSEEEAENRYQNLRKATLLGNSIKHKVKIFFKDTDSDKYIETTVWQLSKDHISLKGGITIPVGSIYKVEL